MRGAPPPLEQRGSAGSPTSRVPTRGPTQAPSREVTKQPTKAPTKAPSKAATKLPTKAPSEAATKAPTKAPIKAPTKAAAKGPTKQATGVRDTATKAPTRRPTKRPSKRPTKAPFVNNDGTGKPAKRPTHRPTKRRPTHRPTKRPTKRPTHAPTKRPTRRPTKKRPTTRRHPPLAAAPGKGLSTKCNVTYTPSWSIWRPTPKTGHIRCFGAQLDRAADKQFAGVSVPAASDRSWRLMQNAKHLKFGPTPSLMGCKGSNTKQGVKQTISPGAGKVCCRPGTDCQWRAGDYTFFQTT